MGHSRLAGSGGRRACIRYLRKAHSVEGIQLRSRSGGARQHDHARWTMKTRLRQGAGRPSRLPLRGSDEGRSRVWDTAAKDGPQARPSRHVASKKNFKRTSRTTLSATAPHAAALNQLQDTRSLRSWDSTEAETSARHGYRRASLHCARPAKRLPRRTKSHKPIRPPRSM